MPTGYAARKMRAASGWHESATDGWTTTPGWHGSADGCAAATT